MCRLWPDVRADPHRAPSPPAPLSSEGTLPPPRPLQRRPIGTRNTPTLRGDPGDCAAAHGRNGNVAPRRGGLVYKRVCAAPTVVGPSESSVGVAHEYREGVRMREPV